MTERDDAFENWLREEEEMERIEVGLLRQFLVLLAFASVIYGAVFYGISELVLVKNQEVRSK